MPLSPIVDWAWDGPPDGPADGRLRLLLLDSLGCMLAGLRRPRVRAFAAALGGVFPGAVALGGARLVPGAAGAVLATAMCWDEANDGLARAHGRPGLTAAPLALAARAAGAPPDLARAAYALAYEVSGRAGETWAIRPGMHVDGSWHSLGAAAAAAKLLGGGPDDAREALRLAACQVPFPLYAPIAAGLDGRNSYPAHAVLLAHACAAAALAGMQAPVDSLAIGRGLALGLTTPIAYTPPGTWLLEEGYLKPYAGVRHAHYAAAAAARLRPRLGGAPPERIEVATYEEALRYARNRAPEAAIAAQFSLSWAVACALVFGEVCPEAFAEATLADPRLRALEAMVELREDPALTAAGARGATVTIRAGGQSWTETLHGFTGDPDQPMTETETISKFRKLAVGTLDGTETERAIAAILGDAPFGDWLA